MVTVSPDWAALLPLIVLTLVGAVLPLIGAFRQVRAGLLAGLAALGVLASAVLTLAMMWPIPGLGFMPTVAPGSAPIVSFALLEMTPFVALFYLVFLAVALMVTVGSPRYLARR